MVSTMQSLDAAFTGASDPLDTMTTMIGGSGKFLQKSVNFILPVMLLLGGVGSIIYRTTTVDGPDAVKPFLVMIVVQLLPMVALKLKTWTCSDLAALMPVALIKTMMMHLTVQIFRLTYHTYAYTQNRRMQLDWWQQCFDCVAFLVGLFILIKGFGFNLGSLFSKEHADVYTTIVGGCLTAGIVNIVAPVDGISVKLCWVLNDFGNYMEVLAFVPVARIVCLEIGVEENASGTNVIECGRQKVKLFMAFILAFYFWDDICFAAATSEIPLVAAGKAAHFVMLLDWAGYFIMRVGAQPKIVDKILPQVLPGAILQEVLPGQDPEMGSQKGEKQGLLGAEDCDEDTVGL